MKPYILNYSETIDIKNRSNNVTVDTTRITETIEDIDDEQISALDVTMQTNTTEHSNTDELLAQSTVYTFTTEPSDEDDILFINQTSTVVTRTTEASDEDISQFSTIETKTVESGDDDIYTFN